MVSVIVPVFNSELYLEECINSVINQTYNQWELILLDDCSSDSSKLIIKKFSNDFENIRYYFFKENVGAGKVRNKGIELAKNRFIAFLDSDDYWSFNKLEIQVDFMLKNKIDFSYTRYYELDKKETPRKMILTPAKIDVNKLIFNNYIKTLTVIYDSKSLGKIYMPEYRKRQDWGLWFNILKKTDYAYGIQNELAYYRTSNLSLSKNKLKLLKENYNFYKNFLKKDALTSGLYLIIFLIIHFHFKLTGYKVNK